MMDERHLFSQETSDKIRESAEKTALDVLARIEHRTKDMGGLDRKKATVTILGETLHAAYIEGRVSCMVDNEQTLRAESVKTLLSSSLHTVQEITRSMFVFAKTSKYILIGLGVSVAIQLANLILHIVR